jgi:Domain of unknown function (DUF4389)
MSEIPHGATQGEPGAGAPSRERSPWRRLPFLVLFIIVYELTKVLVYLVALVQFILHVATGRPNERLRSFGAGLGRYVPILIAYLTDSTDELPFPFGPWPQA